MTWVLAVLWVLLWILIWALAAVAALILLVLILCALPIRYDIKGAAAGETALTVRVSYLLSLVRFTYEYRSGAGGAASFRAAWWRPGKKESGRKTFLKEEEATPAAAANEAGQGDAPPKKSKKKSGGFFKKLKKAYAVLTDQRGKIIMGLVFAALKRLGRILWPKRIDISGVVGFSSPATTGLFVGACEALAVMLRLGRKVRLSGDFQAEATTVRLNFAVGGSFSVLRLAVPVIRLIFKKPIRALIKDIWRKGDSDE